MDPGASVSRNVSQGRSTAGLLSKKGRIYEEVHCARIGGAHRIKRINDATDDAGLLDLSDLGLLLLHRLLVLFLHNLLDLLRNLVPHLHVAVPAPHATYGEAQRLAKPLH